jgi:proteic killer suppression protein
MKYEVQFEKIERQLKKFPIYIVRKLQMWAEQVEMLGLSEVKKIPGYHDEPLMGKRKGQRSIRLSIGYRAYYKINKKHQLTMIDVIEVNKHEY